MGCPLASPQFPRIIKGNAAIQDTIAKAVAAEEVAYVGKTSGGKYVPFLYGASVSPGDVEISDDVFLIRKETADAYAAKQGAAKTESPDPKQEKKPEDQKPTDETKAEPVDLVTPDVPGIVWTGEVPAQKWMNFYTRVLAIFLLRKE